MSTVGNKVLWWSSARSVCRRQRRSLMLIREQNISPSQTSASLHPKWPWPVWAPAEKSQRARQTQCWNAVSSPQECEDIRNGPEDKYKWSPSLICINPDMCCHATFQKMLRHHSRSSCTCEQSSGLVSYHITNVSSWLLMTTLCKSAFAWFTSKHHIYKRGTAEE